jgi:CDP-glucose 4,6-dehydratase
MGAEGPRSVLNVTTDKVYRNREQSAGYVETDELDGFDPYSNSKSCSELVTHSYIRSFFSENGPAVSTARAGNVIGGGDFAKDLIIPDCLRAMAAGERIIVRNPSSVRPYQHVLEPLFAYLLIAERQWVGPSLAGCYNIGPNDEDCVTSGELVSLFCEKWGLDAAWAAQPQEGAPHEAGLLKLDCSLMKRTFGWHPRWRIDECMELICRFGRLHLAGQDIQPEMDREIASYLA